jgi:hypothetical protein
LARKAIVYALRLSPEATALHFTNLDGPGAGNTRQNLRREWREFVQIPAMRAGLNPPSLRFVASEYSSMAAPLLREIEHARARRPNRPITIILPEGLSDARAQRRASESEAAPIWWP